MKGSNVGSSGEALPQPSWAPPAWLLLALLLINTFLLKLCFLEHTSLAHWDEVFHAIVAQNVLKHPFEPTLVDAAYLPYDPANWRENHVWLHKPILPFWQIALSFAVLGVNTFALRLPSAILSTGAAWLTYLIGKELLGQGAGLIAALIQAASPFIVTLIQGYQFADHVDIALLFWVEMGMYFLTRSLGTGSWRDLVLAGVAQGLAFLSKSYLAGIIFGVALTAWLVPICRLGARADCRIGPFRLLVLFYATLLTVAPWLIHCLVNFPRELFLEEKHIWEHLTTSLAPWGATWTKVAFDYLIAIHGVFYTPILVAMIVLFARAFARRQAGLWLVLAWALGVIIPHLFAPTKTPSATLLASPPLLLLLGYLIAQAWRGDFASLAALTAVLAMSIAYPAVIKNPLDNTANPVLGGVAQSRWVTIHVAGALGVLALLTIVRLFIGPHMNPGVLAYVRRAAVCFCLVVLMWLGVRTVRTSWVITAVNLSDPYSSEVGRYARVELSTNAVLICEEHKGYEHLTTMFYADRTCYPLERGSPNEMARRIVQAGGLPYVVSYRSLPLAVVHVCANRGPTIYLWKEDTD